ncbi:proton-conducting transporter membrane subunit [Ferrimonas sp. SCSIO 43195]|uniref:proton-conducting transporter transmembrane domain-containing protein n=1 Tax=Ferrimonas sp. SCSIO 43195 TaxID=2822844 RepID=UPI0020750D88|nr:proton-conducting transporter membrane subunit [Ferrimonas sp. SCSIO 43195]USD36394.1 hypothetical protein J8Z22_15405 [Ferrimonas sp. SCSIO 43195]
MGELSVWAWGGAALLLIGELWAWLHYRNLGKLLLFSTVAEMGYLGLGLGLDTTLGETGAWFHLSLQVVMRLLVIVAAWRLIRRAGSADLTEVAKVAPQLPLTRLMLGFGLFSVMGLSPFKGAFSKFIILYSAVDLGHWALALTATLASVVAAVYTITVIQALCFGPQADGQRWREWAFGSRSWLLMVSLAAMTVLLSLDPEPLLHGIGQYLGLTAADGLPTFETPWHPLVLLPYLSGFGLYVFGHFSHRLRNWLAQGVAAMTLVLVWNQTDLDGLSWLFAVLFALVMLMVVVYSAAYMKQQAHSNRYYFFLMLMLGSLLGVATADNLGNFYLFWELMTWTSYLLVIHPQSDSALRAGRKYFLMCASGAYVMHFGILLLHAQIGSFEFAAISAGVAQLSPMVAWVALGCFMLGLGVKAGLWPLHSWLPDAHPVAPSSISAPMSAILTKAGLFGLLKLGMMVFGTATLMEMGRVGDWSVFGLLLSLLGVITLLYGEIMALRQDNLKRMLAYSTLAQVGEIAAILGLGTYLSLVGGLAHLANHALFKSLLFLAAGAFIYRTGSKRLSDLAGVARQMPVTGLCMAVGLLAIMGLPPFSGFFSKFMMLYAAVAAGQLLLPATILLGSVIGAIYYLRLFRVLYFQPGRVRVNEAPASMLLALVFLASLVLLGGLFPDAVVNWVRPAAALLAPEPGTISVPTLTMAWPLSALLACGGAIVVYLMGRWQLPGSRWAALGVMALALAGVLLESQRYDLLSWWFAILIAAMGGANLCYAKGYMAHSHSPHRFSFFFLMMIGGLLGVTASEDLFNFFAFWELMSSWTLYFVIIHEESEEALGEGFKYFLFNLVGASALFLGVVMLTAYSGSFSFAALQAATAFMPVSWLALALVLVMAGLLMKAAQLPLRIDVQMHPPTAPTPVSGYISAVLLKSGPYGVLKFIAALGVTTLTARLGGIAELPWLTYGVAVIAAVTLLYAGAMAMIQTGIKRLLIYSTVSQLAYVLLGIALMSPLGLAGGLMHFVNHMLLKNMLFMAAGVILAQAHLESLDELGGLGRRMPVTFGVFLFAGLSLSGVPPLNGFASKWLIYQASFESGHYLLGLAALMSSLFTLAAVLKFAHVAFMGQLNPKVAHLKEADWSMRLPMLVLMVVSLIIGAFPGMVLVPVAAVIDSLGMASISVSWFGGLPGNGGWHPATLTLAMALLAWGCWGFYRLSNPVRQRVHLHACGVEDIDAAQAHLPASSLYESPKALIRAITRTKPSQGVNHE